MIVEYEVRHVRLIHVSVGVLRLLPDCDYPLAAYCGGLLRHKTRIP